MSMNKILIVEASDSDRRLMSYLSHRHSCTWHSVVEIIKSWFVSDFSFSDMTIPGADIETGKIDRKDMWYCLDNIRCIFLRTDRERKNTYLARCLLIYPVDNILCALVSQVIDGKTHEEILPVVGISLAVTVALVLIHRNAKCRVTVIETDTVGETSVSVSVIWIFLEKVPIFPELRFWAWPVALVLGRRPSLWRCIKGRTRPGSQIQKPCISPPGPRQTV